MKLSMLHSSLIPRVDNKYPRFNIKHKAFVNIPGKTPVKACVDHVCVVLVVKIALKFRNISMYFY